MRRGIAVVLAIILISSMAVPASASVTPRYTHTSFVYSNLSIDTFWGVATCEGELLAYDDVPVEITVYLQELLAYDDVPVEITVYLQVYRDGEWQTVKSWYASDMMHVYLSKQYAIYRGYEYRTYVEGYVYNSSGYLVEIVDIADTEWYN